MKRESLIIEFEGREITLIGYQVPIFKLLQKSPKTAMQIIEETGIIDHTVRLAIDTMHKIRGCIKPIDEVPVYRSKPQKVWAVGEDPETAKYRQQQLAVMKKGETIKETLENSAKVERAEILKKREAARKNIDLLLKQKNTKFGWLLENAGA